MMFKDNTQYDELVELASVHKAVDGGKAETGWVIEFATGDGTIYAHTSKDAYDRFKAEYGFSEGVGYESPMEPQEAAFETANEVEDEEADDEDGDDLPRDPLSPSDEMVRKFSGLFNGVEGMFSARRQAPYRTTFEEDGVVYEVDVTLSESTSFWCKVERKEQGVVTVSAVMKEGELVSPEEVAFWFN